MAKKIIVYEPGELVILTKIPTEDIENLVELIAEEPGEELRMVYYQKRKLLRALKVGEKLTVTKGQEYWDELIEVTIKGHKLKIDPRCVKPAKDKPKSKKK